MVIETGIIVAGTGYAGSAIARALSSDARSTAPYILLDKKHQEMVLDIILSEAGEVAGALVARNGKIEPIKAPAVVLATGSVAGVFPKGDWTHSGDGLAIAHRAGLALAKPHLQGDELRTGVPCKADGSTALVGLFVAGSLGADRPDPLKVARAAILRSQEGVEAFGPYRMHPDIDSALPPGFAQVKFDRLHGITSKALSGEVPREHTLIELHRLKGEADDFARARCDVELFSLQNACEVAILLFKGT
ncbi:MAG: FAD-binding protein [Candidatus Thermoplasmatota archaeon]